MRGDGPAAVKSKLGYLLSRPARYNLVTALTNILRRRLHDTGMKLWRLKIITFSTIHTVR